MFLKLDLFLSSGEGWDTSTLLGLLERANRPNRVDVFHPSPLRTERDPVSEMFCSFMFFRIPDDGQSPETQ
jgi:hypothetical protein